VEYRCRVYVSYPTCAPHSIPSVPFPMGLLLAISLYGGGATNTSVGHTRIHIPSLCRGSPQFGYVVHHLNGVSKTSRNAEPGVRTQIPPCRLFLLPGKVVAPSNQVGHVDGGVAIARLRLLYLDCGIPHLLTAQQISHDGIVWLGASGCPPEEL
jgi:hypothetical protein